MYLSESERKEIMALYGRKNVVGKDYYQVEPDTWIYLFEDIIYVFPVFFISL